jgi:methionine synthase I (cobalamin-dependent)
MTTAHDLRERFARGGVLFDGGMGSMLIAEGLSAGRPPEEWNRSRPEVLRRVHRAYLDAGAQVIETNTFGATPTCLGRHGLGDQARAWNVAALALARAAVVEHGDPGRLVALSVGPCGRVLPPMGNADESDLRADFQAQMSALEAEQPDLVVIETMFDLREARLALETAKDHTDAPVAVSLTYNRNPRGFFTVMGDEASQAVPLLTSAGADIIGANCSLSGEDMIPLAQILLDSTSLPVLCQPNAGNPAVRDGKPVYEQTADQFAGQAARLFDLGVHAVGGCCGTSPEFIRALAGRVCR